MQWKTRPLGYFSYTVFCCLCKRGDLWPPASAGLSQISIHAPARGATLPAARRLLRQLISIHAPARGATYVVGGLGCVLRISIHAPARGATREVVAVSAKRLFQFTPLREGRPTCGAKNRRRTDFNSRPCERGDAACAGAEAGPELFQFTPLREGRPAAAACCCCRPLISIHAPARGATTQSFSK